MVKGEFYQQENSSGFHFCSNVDPCNRLALLLAKPNAYQNSRKELNWHLAEILDICINNIWMFIFSFSQYHRITGSHIAWGWKGPLEVVWSKPLLKQGHLEQATQGHIHTTFKYLQGGRYHHLCGQPVPLCFFLKKKK